MARRAATVAPLVRKVMLVGSRPRGWQRACLQAIGSFDPGLCSLRFEEWPSGADVLSVLSADHFLVFRSIAVDKRELVLAHRDPELDEHQRQRLLQVAVTFVKQ